VRIAPPTYGTLPTNIFAPAKMLAHRRTARWTTPKRRDFNQLQPAVDLVRTPAPPVRKGRPELQRPSVLMPARTVAPGAAGTSIAIEVLLGLAEPERAAP